MEGQAIGGKDQNFVKEMMLSMNTLDLRQMNESEGAVQIECDSILFSGKE